MIQYIELAALLAEINQRIEDYNSHKIDDSYHDGLIFALEDLRDDFLDTLEVKEVDLEKETKKWWKEHLHLNPENKLWMDAHQSVVFAKHFFELGMRVNNKTRKGE